MRTEDGDDRALTRQALEGDAEAFSRLAGRYLRSAQRVARSVLPEAADAEDAVQDGLLSAWRNLDRYDQSRPFGPWLLRIVVNAARDLARRERVRRAEELSPLLAAGGARPDRVAAAAILGERLAAALAALPERQRVAVTLFDVEGYPHAEIAELLGIPVGTVRSDVFHARRALRRALAPYQEGLDDR